MQSADGRDQFQPTDNWVRRLQRNGFGLVNLEPNALVVRAESGLHHPLPLPDHRMRARLLHWQHWYDYVHAIVERYDGDGTADMPDWYCRCGIT